MKLKKLITAFTIASAILILTACNSTRLLSSWIVPEVQNNTLDKVLVFALVGDSKRMDIQEAFEESIAHDFRKKGVNAVSAFDIYGYKGLKSKSDKELAKEIHDAGYTSVLIISLIDKDENTTYVPPTTTTYAVPVGGSFYGGFYPYYGYYNYRYDEVYTPGYYETETDYIMEARLYYTKQHPDTKDAIYVGQTSTADPYDAQTMASEFSKSIITDMVNKGLIIDKKK